MSMLAKWLMKAKGLGEEAFSGLKNMDPEDASLLAVGLGIPATYLAGSVADQHALPQSDEMPDHMKKLLKAYGYNPKNYSPDARYTGRGAALGALAGGMLHPSLAGLGLGALAGGGIGYNTQSWTDPNKEEPLF